MLARTALFLVAAVCSATAIRADELDDFRAREQIVAQKWTREVTAALDTSRRLDRTDPAAARETVQGALTQLRNAAGLTDAVRGDLARRLEARIAEMNRTTSARTTSSTSAPTSSPARPAYAPPSAPTPAGGLTDSSRTFIDKQRSQLLKGNEVRQDRAGAFSGNMAAVQSSAIPSDQSLALSPNHKDIMARRQPQLNIKEQAIMKALGQTLEADFTGFTFGKALDHITQKTGLVIVPDQGSLREQNVDYDDPVQFKVNARVAVRTILRKILGDRGLAYVITEDGLSVVTTQKARESTTVRIYPVGDLVTPVQPQPQFVYNPFTGGFVPAPPGIGVSANRLNGQMVVDLVKSSVDPSYWAPTGPGAVTFNEATGALIVRASAEIHFMIGNAIYRR